MVRTEPILFKLYPQLKEKIPWIPLLTNTPTPVERLTNLENHLNIESGQIYIKRDDKNHQIYGGNKIRKFEFLFANVLKRKKKKAIVTCGGIGTHHGLASAIICSNFNPPLKCDLYLYKQPVSMQVQESLLLFNHFGAKLHLSKTDIGNFIKALFYWIFHHKYEFILPGGTPIFGRGTSLGIVGFIEAILELKEQINKKFMSEPDVIFVPGGTIGTAAGLVAGCKLLGMKSKIYCVAVYKDFIANAKNLARNANKALKLLKKADKSIPKIKVSEDDFKMIKGYLGPGYGVKTIKGQEAVEILFKLEGKEKGFHLETTYTGKTMAAMLDFLEKDENKSKIVLFWNTYNSNDLNKYLKETNFDYKKLPKKFHKFFEDINFKD
jgi:D-cysteine desulfhydrase